MIIPPERSQWSAAVQGYKNYYLTDKWWKVPEVVRF